jgi:arabinogalactan endo-1,4-beta-galactosidase
VAKTNLLPIRIRIMESLGPDPTAHTVEVAYTYTSSDGDQMDKTRDITNSLSAAQKTAVTSLVTSIRARITSNENIT